MNDDPPHSPSLSTIPHHYHRDSSSTSVHHHSFRHGLLVQTPSCVKVSFDSQARWWTSLLIDTIELVFATNFGWAFVPMNHFSEMFGGQIEMASDLKLFGTIDTYCIIVCANPNLNQLVQGFFVQVSRPYNPRLFVYQQMIFLETNNLGLPLSARIEPR